MVTPRATRFATRDAWPGVVDAIGPGVLANAPGPMRVSAVR
jgi:hypothetical protein